MADLKRLFLGIPLAILSAEVGYQDVRDLLSSYGDVRAEARKRLEQAADPSLLAAMNDVLYYHYFTRDRRVAAEIDALFEKITGETAGGNPRRGWAEWIGRHEEITPRPGYLAFKQSVFIRYDPAFRSFLDPARTFRIRPEEIEWGGVKKDGIPALDRPGQSKASEARYLKGGDRVFGVVLNGEARAYPHRIMDWHEMANDVVGGVPVSLSYCTLCGSGILFRSEVEGRVFTFGSSGLLYRSNKLMYDRQTETLWSNLTGEPVAGPLADSGIRLEVLPVVVSTWDEWRALHPETLVLDVERTGFERDYDKSPYEDYFRSEDTMFPVWLVDDALGRKEWVFALVVNGQPKAYPIDVLKKERVTHDRVRGEEIVLLTEESGAVRAYRSGGKRFRRGSSPLELVEEPGGSIWRRTEDFLVGPGGEKLERLPGHNAYWFGWYAFHPTTELYSGPSER